MKSPIYLICLFIDSELPYTCCTKSSKILGFVREADIIARKQEILDEEYAKLEDWSDSTTNPVIAFVKQGEFIY
jgi:hypothetical protein